MLDRSKPMMSKIQQVVSQERNEFCVLQELENKMQLGVWEHCEPLSGGTGGKALGTFTIISLKLI